MCVGKEDTRASTKRGKANKRGARMSAPITVLHDATRRFAFLARPDVLHSLLPPNAIGTYLLLRNLHPIYVGRSDHCLRTRLLGHELLPLATHVVWELSRSAQRAFHLEAAWFHQLHGNSECLNRIHPARPCGDRFGCPFCRPRVRQAFLAALRRDEHSEHISTEDN